MDLVIIVHVLVGVSIFGLGIGLGGIIEHARALKHTNERDEVYLHNVEMIVQMLHRAEERIMILNERISYTTEEMRRVEDKMINFDPEETQPIDVRFIRENETPSMPCCVEEIFRED
jgi:hypothetical protein